jgi:RNA polymerase sigma factor (TIGR02999 family)
MQPEPDAAASAATADPETVTRLLSDAASGDRRAMEELLAAVYGQLRAIANQRMAGERRDHTLQPTALVHEAYVRLLGKPGTQFESRGHFFRAAAEAMRRILIDHARARKADRRGGGKPVLSITSAADVAADADPAGFLALDDAMTRLEGANPEAASVARLRFYAGLTNEGAAEALGMSPRTARRGWAFARGWLRETLERERV